MRKLSIKLKITLWFTGCMILLAAIIFAFIAVVSRSTSSHQTRGMLMELVAENMEEVEYDDGQLEIDDDFIAFQSGIYCMIFDENGRKVFGYAPYDTLETEPLEDGVVRTVAAGYETYLLYDRLIASKDNGELWVRGVVLDGGTAITSSAVYRAVLFSLPLLILLAALGGYFIAGRSLRPIRKISETADEIGRSGNLSKRIELEEGGDELHQLAGTFNRMFDRLEQNFDAERSFTSDASHELRTPITTILAQCEYAFENASGEQELYDAIGVIQRQGYRMSRLVESLLQFTRMEQHTESADFDTIDLSGLVASICEEQADIADKHISLTSSITPGISMKADATLLSRLLENLIRNAYKYGRENGTVHVSLREEDTRILLSVSDNGIGIAPDELPKIWNRFYRVDKSRSTSTGSGLGLGLAMVAQIAALHGGYAGVESTLGSGSTFSVEFPKSQANNSSPQGFF